MRLKWKVSNLYHNLFYAEFGFEGATHTVVLSMQDKEWTCAGEFQLDMFASTFLNGGEILLLSTCRMNGTKLECLRSLDSLESDTRRKTRWSFDTAGRHLPRIMVVVARFMSRMTLEKLVREL